jgi:hypothetical protein
VAKQIEITQQQGAEVPTEVLAQSIIAVSDAAQKLLSGRLNRRAIVLLIQDSITPKPSKETVEAILDAAADLRRRYVR